MYYLDGLGQGEIANICGVSRSTVSRLLTTARERGIVRISVDEFDPRDVDLERQLIKHFGLRNAIVVREMNGAPVRTRRAVGYFAAPVVAEWIGSQSLVGLAGGRTLGELVHNTRPRTGAAGPVFVQLMGTFGSSPGRIDASELSRTFARRFQGTFLTLNAPAFAQSQQARDLFLVHDEIRSIWNAFDSLDLALVGVGTLDESVLVERGVLKAEAFAEVRAAGAVGEICGRFFNDRGQECASELRDCVVSIGLDALRKCQDVVAVVSGSSRAGALRAAIRGEIVKSLVIDQAGARSLLRTR
jgi:DNA-binding transcriptional regulator LsrR (DeoR family)